MKRELLASSSPTTQNAFVDSQKREPREGCRRRRMDEAPREVILKKVSKFAWVLIKAKVELSLRNVYPRHS